MKSIKRKINAATTRLYVKGQLLKHDCADALANNRGSLTVEQATWIIVSIVLIVGVVLIKVWDTLEGSLDNADSKIDAIWDYKG